MHAVYLSQACNVPLFCLFFYPFTLSSFTRLNHPFTHSLTCPSTCSPTCPLTCSQVHLSIHPQTNLLSLSPTCSNHVYITQLQYFSPTQSFRNVFFQVRQHVLLCCHLYCRPLEFTSSFQPELFMGHLQLNFSCICSSPFYLTPLFPFLPILLCLYVFSIW